MDFVLVFIFWRHLRFFCMHDLPNLEGPQLAQKKNKKKKNNHIKSHNFLLGLQSKITMFSYGQYIFFALKEKKKRKKAKKIFIPLQTLYGGGGNREEVGGVRDIVGQFSRGVGVIVQVDFRFCIVRNNILKILNFGADMQKLTCSYLVKNVLRLSKRQVYFHHVTVAN